MKAEDKKRFTVEIPINLWRKVRRLEDSGKVKSLKEAVIKGLEWLTK